MVHLFLSEVRDVSESSVRNGRIRLIPALVVSKAINLVYRERWILRIHSDTYVLRHAAQK